MAKQPNVLLILTDQQTISAMSGAGNPHLRTPAMDALAQRGVRFTRSWCANPVCGPSRASLFTGRTTSQLGAWFNPCSIPDDMRTLGESFRDAGYQTPYIGKWHVPDSYPPGAGDIPGFDNDAITEDQRLHLGEIADPLAVTRARDFLMRKHHEPFFLTVSLLNPHDICYHISNAFQEVLGKYWPKEVDELPPLPDNFAIQSNEPKFQNIRRQETQYGREMAEIRDWDETRWRQYLFAYYRMTETVDAHIGEVLKALDKGGHSEDTIVVFTSDHGESVAAHRMVVKLSLYEESLAVPLVICDPRSTLQDKVIEDWRANGVDLAPTLLDLTGLPPEKQHAGRSLAPALQRKADERRYNVAEVYPKKDRPEVTGRAIEMDGWKYCAFGSDYGFEESLVNLGDDPGELVNLLAEPNEETAAKRLKLIAKLREWCAHTGDDFPSEQLV